MLAHAGGAVPYLAWRLEQAGKRLPQMAENAAKGATAAFAGFIYDTALSVGPASLAALRALVPPDRILFGSDWPYVLAEGVGATIARVEAHLDASAEDRARVAGGNALGLFPCPAATLGARTA